MFRRRRLFISLYSSIKHNIQSPSSPFVETTKQTTRARPFSWGRPPAPPPTPPSQPTVVRTRDGYYRFNNNSNSYYYQQDASACRRKQLTLMALLGGAGTVVWASSREEIPYTGRKHAILVDIHTERELGAQTFRQVLMEAKMKGSLLPPSHPAVQAVTRVGRRIAAVASDGQGGGYAAHMKGLQWEFAVIHSPEVNAFVVPGGKVVVYTGLLRMLRTEDELAAVLSHEAGHVVARHVAERLTQGSVIELTRILLYWMFGLPIPAGPLTAVVFLPNSRRAEHEADVIGVQLAARACFDPAAAVEVFAKLGAEEAKHGGNMVPAVLRTHPVSSERIRKIKEQLPRAEYMREQEPSCGSYVADFNGSVSFRGSGKSGLRGVRTVADWG